jgi:hypothetical protein
VDSAVDQSSRPATGRADGDRELVAFLKLAAAADRTVGALRGTPLTDQARSVLGELVAAVDDAWTVLGPDRRMGARPVDAADTATR